MGGDRGRQEDRAFRWFNATQFLGALNDNFFKLLVAFFLIGRLGQEASASVMAAGAAVFVVPFLLLTGPAGRLADSMPKVRIVVALKAAEVGVAVLGALALWTGHAVLLYAALFLLAAQSALFAPAKYGMVPELVAPERLARANGTLSMTTQLAIIGGTALAPLLVTASGGNYPAVSSLCVVLAAAGLWCSVRLRTLAVSAPVPVVRGRNPAGPSGIRLVFGDADLRAAVLASAALTAIGAHLQLSLVPYGIATLGLEEARSGFLFLVPAIGIAAGARLAARWSGRGVEFGVVPLGLFGLAAGTAALALLPSTLVVAGLLLTVLGLCYGMVTVPLQTFLQRRAPAGSRGRVQAVSNWLSWVGVLLASGAVHGQTAWFGLTARQSFLVTSVLCAAVGLASLRRLGDFVLRFLAARLVAIFYRVRVEELERLPDEGPALLVPNHVAYVDALILLATQPRRIRFVMAREIFEKRWLRPVCRLMGVIPISGRDTRGQVEVAMQQARDALSQGFLVCIFPEGALTRDGRIATFRRGMERIVAGTSHAVVPVGLQGLWGSMFSRRPRGRGRASLRRREVRVRFGTPLGPGVSAAAAREAVVGLAG